jgi:hypothetical protein
MLQCSNCKGRPSARKSIAFERAVSGVFYQKLDRGTASGGLRRYERMEPFMGAPVLRNLLSLAIRLRRLADDSRCLGDQALYLMTAEALEKRAEWLAATAGPPPEEVPPEQVREERRDPRLHTPVDVTI